MRSESASLSAVLRHNQTDRPGGCAVKRKRFSVEQITAWMILLGVLAAFIIGSWLMLSYLP